MTASKSYYVKRSGAVAVGALLGAVTGVLWLFAAVWAGSRFGEWIAGGRQPFLGASGYTEAVAHDNAA